LEEREDKKEEAETSSGMVEEVSPAGEVSIETLKDELGKKEAECKELGDKYLRALAEMDNFRKRVAREQSESVKFANEKILCDLLSVVDNMERAVLHSREKKDFDALIDGLELTMKEFSSVFDKYGVKCIESVGQPFDPNRHHAVAIIESESHQDNTIVEEFRKGYVLNDRILRPSIVSVSKKKDGAERNQD